ncbi:transglutaminase-like domain-containing protein [Demequina sp. NBRC 110055]|uniref:transglutaminase-like domain-containing protein n=1 Tax=Demequina sp. NBRC 110055 TaxID=1570344 RepID=UPI000A01C35B|nr:transglutaminase-like domain-containing protein [Demequina sp. NBRC 110055]
MSARDARRPGRRARAAAPTTLSFALINAAFVAAGAAVAAWTLYPVYESSRYVAAAALAVGAGAAIAVLCDRLRWGGGRAALMALAVYVVGGLTLVVPGATSGVDSALGAGWELLRGPVLGWKDIVTLPLPLGEYRATIVPVFAAVLTGTTLAAWWALRSERRWGAAAGVLVALEAMAILVGPVTRADTLAWAPLGTFMSRELVVGLAQFLVILGWFAWRASYARRRAIAVTRAAGGVHLAGPPRHRVMADAGAGLAMLVAAVVLGVVIAGPLAAATPREVARSAIEPRLTVDSTVTPLASFRENFSDDAYDAVLFTVAVQSGEADRVRIASLPYFDGDTYSASAPEGSAPARFQRVPSRLNGPDGASAVSAEIGISSGGGVWVPVVGELGEITFSGPRRAQLVDNFYYLPEADAGVMALESGVASGDSYEVTGYVRDDATVADLGASPGAGSVPASLIPDSLRDWVAAQGVSRDGEGLAELVRRLRARGYLSHDLEQPDPGTRWVSELGDYAFVSSAAGHSYDRIDRLFTALNERAAEVGDAASDAQLVAAAGDDEQFAAATALIASSLGFPSRVVLGARLSTEDPDVAPVCDGGECRGGHMTAWVEVQGTQGTWVPIDVTPQHAQPVSPDISSQRDPEFASPLDPENAEAIVPPATQRGTSDDAEPPEIEEPVEPAWWVGVVRIVAVSLLGLAVLLAPIIAIVLWKVIRRRRRRGRAPTEAVHGGWDEYLDTAAEAGLAAMPLATRAEVAAAYSSPHAATLATLTDRATFSGRDATADDAARFWDLVDSDRQYWLASRGWWKRQSMRLSLRSLWRSSANEAERGGAPTQTDRQHWRSDHTGATARRRRRSRTVSSGARKDGTR